METTPINVTRAESSGARADSRFENQTLIRQLELAVVGSATLNELLGQISRVICEQSECLALWISQAESAAPDATAGQPRFQTFIPLTDDQAESVWITVEETALALVQHLCQSNQIGSVHLPFNAATQLVAAPLRPKSRLDSSFDFILLGCFQVNDQSVLRLQWLLGIATQTVTNWFQSRSIAQTESKQRSLLDALKLVSELDQTTSRTQAAIVVVNQLRQLLNVDQVSITINEQLMAISDVEQIDVNSESNKMIQTACNQTLITGKPIQFLNSDDAILPEQLALEAYCHSHRIDTCINVPLQRSELPPYGGLLVAGSNERLNDPDFAEYFNQLLRLLGGHLDIVWRANRGVKEITSEKIKSLRNHRWRTIGLFLLAGVAIVMCFPMPYRVACDCELQPVLRRFVAAPYDGILERTLVENGDIVQKNQLLAQLDGRNLRIELAGLNAEFAGAKKRRDSALAIGDIAQSQIARSETERLTAKIQMLEQRSTNLEIRSPIDGIIVSGDLEKVEGAPLEMGRTLFEVAPLNQMVSEIAIPESEIKYVKPEMTVAIKLNSFPFQTWSGVIKTIHPRSEILNNESVFVAQVILDNEGDLLRPGMKGSTKIKSCWAPLGWNLFHRPWEAVRYWTIW